MLPDQGEGFSLPSPVHVKDERVSRQFTEFDHHLDAPFRGGVKFVPGKVEGALFDPVLVTILIGSVGQKLKRSGSDSIGGRLAVDQPFHTGPFARQEFFIFIFLAGK